MKWSWHLGVFLGIEVRIHATFLLLLLWFGITNWVSTGSASQGLAVVAFIIVLFLCVVLHEYGHALAARRYGIETRDITLLPIGGVARLEKMPEDPRQELVVAIAGPAVNIVIAALLFAILALSGRLPAPDELATYQPSLFDQLLYANIFLVLFNAVPAFPMDGGRVLRALLALRFEYSRATRWAANLGQAFALLFALLGLFGNPLLIFIGIFVWIGASAEAEFAQRRTVFRGRSVSEAMMTEFRTLSRNATLGDAADLILAGAQADFPVVDADEIRGIVTRAALVEALAEHGEASPVSAAMTTEFCRARSDESLDDAFMRLQECPCRTMPVIDPQGELVGLLTPENVGELLMLELALRRHRE